MMIVGLTGGIGSGKTTAAKMFKELGVPVYNSDKEAKKLMQSSKKVRKALIGLLGAEAYHDKKLNRSYIANQVFNNDVLLQKLNAIVHPAVRKHFLSWAKKQDALYVIQESAIIFENDSQDFYDKIILITAPLEDRMKRVLKRDNTSKNTVLNRMENQWEDDKKIPLSHFVVENVDLVKTQLKIEEVHQVCLNIAKDSRF